MPVSEKEFKKRVDALAEHKFFKGETEETYQADPEYTKLATSVKYRVQALRKMQLEEIQARTELEEQRLLLEQQYHERLERSFKQRQRIVNGEYEPDTDELLKKVVDDPKYKPSKTVAGIPDFWFNVLVNAEMSSGWVDEEIDKPLLQKLKDIRIVFGHQSAGGDASAIPPAGVSGGDITPHTSPYDQFTIEFEFDKNDYINDTILTKTYFLETKPNPTKNPFEYAGAQITSHKGTDIHWKNGKSLSYKLVTKKQRNPKTGATRTVKRKEKLDSFFNFFENFPVINPEKDSEEQQEAKEEEIELDYELGEYFRDKIVPNAVLIFTNEFQDDEICSDDEDSDDESDEDEDPEESDDEEDDIEAAEKPDCKQQ